MFNIEKVNLNELLINIENPIVKKANKNDIAILDQAIFSLQEAIDKIDDESLKDRLAKVIAKAQETNSFDLYEAVHDLEKAIKLAFKNRDCQVDIVGNGPEEDSFLDRIEVRLDGEFGNVYHIEPSELSDDIQDDEELFTIENIMTSKSSEFNIKNINKFIDFIKEDSFSLDSLTEDFDKDIVVDDSPDSSPISEPEPESIRNSLFYHAGMF